MLLWENISLEQQQTVFHGENLVQTVMLLILPLRFNLLPDLDGLFLDY